MTRLLQWNIWNKEDIDNIIKELKRIKADIVCIQELAIKDDNDIKIRKLKEVYPYFYYEKADTFLDGYSQCNTILSKYPLYDKNYTYVQKPTDNKNDYSKEGRVYVEAKVKVNNKELTIGTTHLSYTDRFKETKFKDKEVTRSPESRPPYIYQIPLTFMPGLGGKTIDKLLGAFGTEMNILHKLSEDDIEAVVGKKVATTIMNAKEGKIHIQSGGGGVYGKLTVG